MNIHDATEQAYKNGYDQGKKDAALGYPWTIIANIVMIVIFIGAVILTAVICSPETPNNTYDYAYVNKGNAQFRIEIDTLEVEGDYYVITDKSGDTYYTARENVLLIDLED